MEENYEPKEVDKDKVLEEKKITKFFKELDLDKKKILVISSIFVGVLLLGILGGYLFIRIIGGDSYGDEKIINANEKLNDGLVSEVKKEVQIFKGNDRPIAIMIDNEKLAWPHSGLNDAYLLYEAIIESGETRIMALFKGKNTDKIGPIRSSRHYFLDYAMENDALYVHFGWSPQAQSDIKKYDINNINGIYDNFFWRVEPLNSYHNAFTSMKNILQKVESKKYRTTSDDKGVLTYSAEEITLNSSVANNITIKFSSAHKVEFKYNVSTKLYERYQRGIQHKDRYTAENIVAKNIIVCYINNGLLDDPEQKGRQELYNIGTGEGVYLTNGEYIEITWDKQSRSEKTKYYSKDGKEIVLNDGITWIEIIPKNNKVEIQ